MLVSFRIIRAAKNDSIYMLYFVHNLSVTIQKLLATTLKSGFSNDKAHSQLQLGGDHHANCLRYALENKIQKAANEATKFMDLCCNIGIFIY